MLNIETEQYEKLFVEKIFYCQSSDKKKIGIFN